MKKDFFSPKIKIKYILFSYHLHPHNIGSPNQCNKARERNKGIQIRKEDTNMSLFAFNSL